MTPASDAVALAGTTDSSWISRYGVGLNRCTVAPGGSMPRLSFNVSLAAFAIATLGSSGYQPALRLRIQALSQNSVQVRVSMTASGAQSARRWSDTVVATPAVLPIADSIQGVRIVVSGLGSVRATLTDSEHPGRDLLIAEGRDLTLSRDARGRFSRASTAQPVVP